MDPYARATHHEDLARKRIYLARQRTAKRIRAQVRRRTPLLKPELNEQLFSREFTRWGLTLGGNHVDELRQAVLRCRRVAVECTYYEPEFNRTYCFFTLTA